MSLTGEFIKEYESARSIEKELSISYKHVSMNCLGKLQRTKDYIFVFKKDYDLNKDYNYLYSSGLKHNTKERKKSIKELN